jgi:hypothetical protein
MFDSATRIEAHDSGAPILKADGMVGALSKPSRKADQGMAYIIRDDHAYRLGKTEVEFFDDDLKALDAFFDQSVAYPGTFIRATWVSGTWIPPEVMPRRLRLLRGKTMYDWLVVRGGATLVSSRFRDAVEELDPGRHQFFPVVVEDKNGVAWPGDFFVFNVVGRIEAIIEDRSNLKASGRGWVDNWSYVRVGPWQCALDAAVIGGRACWVEHRFGECWFISERLAALLQERKLNGFRLAEHSDEISL